MSKYDDLRTDMGLQAKKQNSSNTVPSGQSKYNDLRMDMGIIPDTRPMEAIRKYNSAKPLNLIESAMPKTSKVETKPLTAQQFKTSRIENLAKQKETFGTLQPVQTQPSLGKRVKDTAQDVGQFLSDFPGAFTDSATFGLSDLAVRSIGGETIEEQQARNKRIGGKVGGAAGYVMPGSAIESGVSLAARPLIQNLPKAAQLATTGAASGIIEGAAQEAGDVTFRQGTFDPENVALSGALGGGVNAVLGTAIPAVQRSVANKRVGNELMKSVRNTDLQVTPTSGITPNANAVTAETDALNNSLFTNLFGEQGVGITPFGTNKSNRMVSTEQQIVSNPLTTNVKGVVENTKQLARATYQNNVDYLSPLKNISKKAYDAALDASRANNLANTIVRDKFVDNEGNVIGKSLDEIMKVSRGLGKKVDDYLIARHAITRMERGERVYDEALKMTPEKLRQKIVEMEKRYPQLAQIGRDWNEFNGNLLGSGVREGLISQAAMDAMREQNPNYASMRRQFDISEKLAQPKWGNGGSAFSGQKAPIKEVSPTGSTRKIVSPFRSAIEQTYAWKNAELRNRTMQELVRAVQTDPEGMKGIVEIVKKPSTSYRSLDDALREGGTEEFLELLDNDFKTLFQNAKPGEENIVRAMVKGNPVFLKVNDPEAVKALVGMGSESAGMALRALQILSNATKRGATGALAPLFSAKNLTIDVVQAAIQSPNPFKHIAVDLPYAIISSIADTFKIPGLRNLAQDFRRSGGEYSGLLRGDRPLNRAVSSLRREAPLSPRGIAKGVVTAAKSPYKALEKVSDITENVNRMAAFHRYMKGKERTPENVRNAINAAREATTNFSRRGAHSRQWEAFVPYSNSAVQGIYRVTKSFVKNPLKTVAGVMTLVVGPKLYEFSKFNDDPDYQEIPARERYRNLIYSKNADGSFKKIPLPPEYNAIGAFITDVLNDVINNDPQAYKGTLDALANAYTTPFISGALQGLTQGGGIEQSLKGLANSTTISPFVAVLGNQSYTGSPIVAARYQDNSPGQQYDERTSSIAKTIGQKIGMSPIKVDYLIRAYGGDPARLLLPLTSDVGGGTVRNTLLKNFIVDPVFTNTLTDDFYSMKELITMAEKDNSTHGVPFPSWYTEEIADYATSQKKSGINKRLSNLSNQKRAIQGDKTISAQVKAQKLREVQRQMNDIYLEAVTQMQEAGIPLRGR